MNRTAFHRLRRLLLAATATALFSTAPTALAGSGVGAVFNLGQTNSVNAPSTLTGTTGGAQLKIVNASSADIGLLAQSGGGAGAALYGSHTTATGSGAAVRADSASTAANAFSLYARLLPASPGSPSAAIRAESKSTGTAGYGLWASHAGPGSAVYGTAPNGNGVLGASPTGIGVYGKHTAGFGSLPGVQGESASGAGAGVVGRNTGGGPGLSAVVNAGAPPLIVNSDTKVAYLNADKLDGFDSTGFLAATGTAADSDKLDGLDSTSFWKLGGNASTTAGTDFLGTTDGQALELKVNGSRALRLEPAQTFRPNVVGGSSANAVLDGAYAATIAGGGYLSSDKNVVYDRFGTIGGGRGNVVGIQDGFQTQDYASVAGGYGNGATGSAAAVGGGSFNSASGFASAVPGGTSNLASGDSSLAAGNQARATTNGSFVWGDSTVADITSPAADTFTVRAAGGIWFGTSSSPSIPSGHFLETSTGGYLTSAGVWTDVSDRVLKHRFRAVDKRSVLEKVARMPITSWSYKAETPSIRHIGPTAQDFHAAFGLGLDDKHIATIDEGGVALAAIQGLYRQNLALQRRVAKLERELARAR